MLTADKYHGGVPTDHWHKFRNPMLGNMANAAGIVGATMFVTNWSFIQAAVGQAGTGTTVTTASFTPAVGDLMVCWFGFQTFTTSVSSASVGDTGANTGWNVIVAPLSNSTHIGVAGWWRQAVDADTSGITVTCTQVGGGTSSAPIYRNEVDCIRLPAGFSGIALDFAKADAPGTAQTTQTWSPSSGSSLSSFPDVLSVQSLFTPSSNGGTTGTNQFANSDSGSSPFATTGTGSANAFTFNCRYIGAAQDSATAAHNSWTMTWTTSRFCALAGANFTYSTISPTAGLSASASLAANGTVTALGTASPAASASLSASGTVSVLGAASPGAVASLTASGTVEVLGSASPAPVASLDASGLVSAVGSASLSATAELLAAGSGTGFGMASLTATAGLLANGTTFALPALTFLASSRITTFLVGRRQTSMEASTRQTQFLAREAVTE